ncbi:MAG TPA: hypothetical protein PKI19_04875 [Elusimicrobiales bacterium]|nr:hypothetical protein [Elusimicrobiales bacterium]
MLKKIVLLAGMLLLSAPGFAQQSGQKYLVIVRDGLELPFGLSLLHIVQLKQAGAQVQALFEADTVMYFLGAKAREEFSKPMVLPTRPIIISSEPNPVDMVDTPQRRSGLQTTGSVDTPASRRIIRNSVDFKQVIAGRNTSGSEAVEQLMAQLKELKVPYTLCSLSASLLGVYDKLRAAGAPLSAEKDKAVDITPYLKDGYQLAVF